MWCALVDPLITPLVMTILDPLAAFLRAARVVSPSWSMLGFTLLLARASAANPPNVVLFYADDLGYRELGCYGHPEFRSPHIDSIARNGIRFTQGYVSAPSAHRRAPAS